MLQLLFGSASVLLVFWGLLGSIMLVRWGLVKWRRRRKGEEVRPAQKRLNPYYASLCLLTILVPIFAWFISRDKPRYLNRYGDCLVFFTLAGLLLFIIGQYRHSRYHPWNNIWIVAIFLMFPLSLGILGLLAFASGFSV